MCVDCSYVCFRGFLQKKLTTVFQARQHNFARDKKRMEKLELEQSAKIAELKEEIENLQADRSSEDESDSEYLSRLHSGTRRLVAETTKRVKEKMDSMHKDMGMGHKRVLNVLQPRGKGTKRALENKTSPAAKRRKVSGAAKKSPKRKKTSNAKKAKGKKTSNAKKTKGKKKRKLQGLRDEWKSLFTFVT